MRLLAQLPTPTTATRILRPPVVVACWPLLPLPLLAFAASDFFAMGWCLLVGGWVRAGRCEGEADRSGRHGLLGRYAPAWCCTNRIRWMTVMAARTPMRSSDRASSRVP